MFLPRSLRCDDFDTLAQVIDQIPLGSLVTHDEHACAVVDHLPFILEPPDHDTPYGALLTHAARANSHWRTLPSPSPALVTFHTPGAYISPGFYATYSPGARHVPTFYYVAVHARGELVTYHDRARFIAHLEALGAHFERGMEPAWGLRDAEPDYLENLLSGIVGLRLVLTEPLVGKFKLGQNRLPEDRQSVLIHLRRGDAFARQIADYIGQGHMG